MKNIFTDDLEIVKKDPRFFRQGYNINSYSLFTKCFTTFEGIDLKDKTILDLGSCTGSYGYWCEYYGAKEYIGVELSQESTDIMNEFFKDSKVCSGICSDVEDFLKKCNRQFDIVVLSGVLYYFLDYFSILKKSSEIAKEFILIENQGSRYSNDVTFETINLKSFIKEDKIIKTSRVPQKHLDFLMEEFGTEKIKTNQKDLKNIATEFSTGIRYIARYKKIDKNI